jgi:hypothetical protein
VKGSSINMFKKHKSKTLITIGRVRIPKPSKESIGKAIGGVLIGAAGGLIGMQFPTAGASGKKLNKLSQEARKNHKL